MWYAPDRDRGEERPRQTGGVNEINVMSLIQRYIFRRTARLSLQALLATTVIVIITQVLNYVDVLADSGQSMLTFGKLSMLMIPAMLVVVAPFAILIGASQTLSQMNADSELAVVEAAGGSQRLAAAPVVVFGLITSLVTLGLANAVEPWSNRQFRDIITNAASDMLRLAVTSGSFRKVEENLYVQVAEQVPGGTFGGIFIADLRDAKTELLYYARRGAIVDRDPADLLVMQDGEIHRRAVDTGETSIIRFASYALDFSQFGPSGRGAIYFPKERTTAYLWNPDPNDTFSQTRPQALRSELHRRFTEWLYPCLFGLIAAYFAGSARSNREERLWSLGAAGAVALSLRIVGFITANGAGSSTTMLVLSYASPLAAIAIFGTLLAANLQVRIPQRLVDRIGRAFAAVDSVRQGLARRIGARQRIEGGA